MVTRDKKSLEDMLKKAREEFSGEAVLYAAERKPDRSKYRKKPSLIDVAYAKAIEDAENARKS